MGKRKKTNLKLNKKPQKTKLAGHNIMVTKVESESSAEESLPSVFGIAPPDNKETRNDKQYKTLFCCYR